MKRIDLFKSVTVGTELGAIKDVLDSGWWAQGEKVKEFEFKFARSVGAQFAIATNSCTAALDIAVRIAGLKDIVTVSPLTFVSSALCILNAGKEVEFVDIDPRTLCTPKADIQVLYAGNDAGEGKIYDMAHSGGAQHKGMVSCWSFHAVKNLPTGDGGMLTMNDANLYRRAKALSWCGIDKSTYDRSHGSYSWDYNITEVGLKANMNDITAAIGVEQLDFLQKRNARRAQIAEWYDKYLSPLIARPYPSKTWHMYVIQVPKRDELYDKLAKEGISAGVHYKPLYKYSIFPQTPLPNTERIWPTLITLPMHLKLLEADVKRVANVVNKHVNHLGE